MKIGCCNNHDGGNYPAPGHAVRSNPTTGHGIILMMTGNVIAIAYSLDAADVALANQFGPLTLTEMKVWVNASEFVND